MAEQMRRSRTPLSVRVPDDMIRRLDRLVLKLGKDPNLAALGRVSRSAVVKLALIRGIVALEQEYK